MQKNSILAVIVIIIMAVFIIKLNSEKSAEAEKSTQLQTQVNSLNGTVSNLQGKIDSISKTINSNNANTQGSTNSSSSTNNSNLKTNTELTKENKIILEGRYSEGAVGYVYEFHNDETIVQGDELVDRTGTYETVGEKQIKVTLTEKTTSNMDTPEKKVEKINESYNIIVKDENTLRIIGENDGNKYDFEITKIRN